MKIVKTLSLILIFYLAYSFVFPQAAGTRGSVSGVVRNTEGATLAQAKVRISGPLLPAGREYITTENGVFRFANLLPGKYKLEITHPELIDLTIDVIVSLDRETQVEAIMVPVGRVEEEVTVTAAAPLVDTRSTEISTNIDSKTIQSLPLGRTYGSLIALAPGVAGGRLNAGGNQQDNVFLYDGSNVTNPFFANLFSSFSELDIQEINIKRGAVSAEFGRAIGMVTNAITKSGTNNLSGSARFVFEPSEWYAKFKDPTIVTKTDVTRPSLGFGGPFIKDKLWWYLSANLPYSKTTGRINKWGPVPDSKYPTREFFLKINATPTPKLQIVVSIRNSSTEGKNAGIGVYDHPSCATNYEGTERIYYFSLTWVISPNSYLEVKYDHVDQKNRDVPVTELGYKPAPFDVNRLDKMGFFRTVAGFLFGAPEIGLNVGASPMYNTQDFFRDELKVVFTQYLDFPGHSHVIKAGFGYDYGGEYLDRKANGWGSITYLSNIAPFVGGSARPGFRCRYMPEGSTQRSAGRTYAIFAQDTITIRERLTLYLGLLLNRDEYLTFGKNEFNFLVDKDAYIAVATKGYETRKFYFDFWDEIQPRIGFTLVLDKRASDKLYGNFGRYYALDNKSIARAAAPRRIFHVDAYFELTGAYVTEIPSAAETGKVIDPNIKPNYQDEFVLGYSRTLFNRKWVVDTWFQYRRVKNVIEDYPLVNYGKWAAPSRFIYSHVPWAKRYYRAFNVQIQRPFEGKWSFLLMYTWSKLWGNWDLDYAESLFYASSALDDCPGLYMTDPNREGILLGDRTHILKIFATWEFWKRTYLGAYFRYQSGAPWQAQGRSWWYAYRTYLEPAGSRRVDPWANLDLQISHNIPLGKLNGVIEARIMNAFNNQAVLYVDPVKYFDVVTWAPYTPKDENPNFGKPTSYASPRRFCLTFYLNF